jgi:hypothetical protein
MLLLFFNKQIADVFVHRVQKMACFPALLCCAKFLNCDIFDVVLCIVLVQPDMHNYIPSVLPSHCTWCDRIVSQIDHELMAQTSAARCGQSRFC